MVNCGGSGVKLANSLDGNILLRRGQAITDESRRENTSLAALGLRQMFAMQSFSCGAAEAACFDLLCAVHTGCHRINFGCQTGLLWRGWDASDAGAIDFRSR